MNILLIASRDPRGPSYGRKTVLRTIIRSLVALGHRVTIAAIGKPAEPGTDVEYLGARLILLRPPNALQIVLNIAMKNLTGHKSLNECLFRSPRIRRQLRQLAAAEQVHLVVADMIRTAEYAADIGLPWFIDLDDLLSTRYADWSKRGLDGGSVLGHYGEHLGRVPRAVLGWVASRQLNREAQVLRRREIDVARRADGVSLVSEPEALELARRSGRSVVALPMALAVPQDLPLQLSARPIEMAFTGGLDYRPNLEAVSDFAANLAPYLKAEGLDCWRLHVFGHCPEPVRRSLQCDSLILHGYVDDLFRKLSQCQVFLAPLRPGTGVKTKVVEAMLLGLPVVTTSSGIQGLEVRHREHCYIWQTPDELVRVLREIDDHPEDAQRVARAGQQYALERFSPAVLKRRWGEVASSFMPGCLKS